MYREITQIEFKCPIPHPFQKQLRIIYATQTKTWDDGLKTPTRFSNTYIHVVGEWLSGIGRGGRGMRCCRRSLAVVRALSPILLRIQFPKGRMMAPAAINVCNYYR